MALRLNAPLRRFAAIAEAPSLRTATRKSIPFHRNALLSSRPFTTSPSLLKKRKIAAASNSPARQQPAASQPSSTHHDADDDAGRPQPDPENPLDFSAVTSTFGPMDTHFKSQLHALLHGGRFNPDNIGALLATIKTTDPTTGAKDTEHFPLRELCQVVPRSGRTISLLVNDREYIKPIMSAVQASPDFNQQPQRSEDNDLELLLKVELERKEDMVKRVKEVTQTWRERVRHARTKHEKVLKGWQKNKTVVADVVKKAEKELQKVQDKKMKEIDDEEARTIKQLERNTS